MLWWCTLPQLHSIQPRMRLCTGARRSQPSDSREKGQCKAQQNPHASSSRRSGNRHAVQHGHAQRRFIAHVNVHSLHAQHSHFRDDLCRVARYTATLDTPTNHEPQANALYPCWHVCSLGPTTPCASIALACNARVEWMDVQCLLVAFAS